MATAAHLALSFLPDFRYGTMTFEQTLSQRRKWHQP